MRIDFSRMIRVAANRAAARFVIAGACGVALVGISSTAWAVTTGTYGDVTVVNQANPPQTASYQLTSTPAGAGYAGLYFDYTDQLVQPTLASIAQLSAEYDMTEGAFGGGAPRFSIGDTTNNAANEAYVYWGTPGGSGAFTNPAANNTWASTGNYADLISTDLRVLVNGFGGDNTGPNSYETWAQFVANDGTVPIGFITIDLDGGFTPETAQQMLVDQFTVNGDTLTAPTPEPASLSLLGLGALGLLRRRKA